MKCIRHCPTPRTIQLRRLHRTLRKKALIWFRRYGIDSGQRGAIPKHPRKDQATRLSGYKSMRRRSDKSSAVAKATQQRTLRAIEPWFRQRRFTHEEVDGGSYPESFERN